MRMSSLYDLYQEGGIGALRTLAEQVGSSGDWLWQCAVRWRGKSPSRRLAEKLIEAEPRLTWAGLYENPARARGGSNGETLRLPAA